MFLKNVRETVWPLTHTSEYISHEVLLVVIVCFTPPHTPGHPELEISTHPVTKKVLEAMVLLISAER